MPYNRWEDVFYTCEWQNCNSMFDTDDIFYEHVLQHVQEIIDKTSGEDAASAPICLWCACTVEPDSQYIMRHLYYHAFHTKLMARGAHLAGVKKWPRCHADSSNRVVIPIIPGPFVCGWRFCEFQSNNVDIFYAHVDEHPQEYKNGRYPPDTVPFCQWDDCGHISNRLDHLVLHLGSHTRKRVLACPQCGDMFVTSDALREHLLRQALIANATKGEDGVSSVTEHACLQCGRVYASERMLRDHLKRHVNIVKCDQCEMTCSSKYALRRHMQYKHMSARPFHCESCDYRAKSSNDLLHHVQKRHEKATIQLFCCAHCDYSCKRANSLIKHERMAHAVVTNPDEAKGKSASSAPRMLDSRPYECHLCKRRYKLGKLLSHHLRTRHQLCLPPGFSKFTYQLCEDGLHRLQTTRLDSLEVIQQILGVKEVERLLSKEPTSPASGSDTAPKDAEPRGTEAERQPQEEEEKEESRPAPQTEPKRKKAVPHRASTPWRQRMLTRNSKQKLKNPKSAEVQPDQSSEFSPPVLISYDQLLSQHSLVGLCESENYEPEEETSSNLCTEPSEEFILLPNVAL